MIQHITYASDHMSISAKRCVESALKYGCNKSISYGPNNIHRDFYNEFKHIFETTILDANGNPRGAGFWLWKPYIILEALKRADMGDIIVYTDAGLDFVADVNNLINEMPGDVMVFGNGWRHGDWCKGDVLDAMQARIFVNADQVQASCVVIRKSEYSFQLVDEWLMWCKQPNFIDDTPSFSNNEPTFREHRHDQAILTNIILREGIPYNRWPVQYPLKGNERFKNRYGQVFYHHRRRNNQY